MEGLAELFEDKNYELLARRYFDWLIEELGNGDPEVGRIDLARRYNDWAYGNRPLVIPDDAEVRAWLLDRNIIHATDDEIREINRCLEYELKNRIEEEQHHENPLNP